MPSCETETTVATTGADVKTLAGAPDEGAGRLLPPRADATATGTPRVQTTVLVSRAVILAGRNAIPLALTLLVAGFMLAQASCRGEPSAVFAELVESRRLAADLRVQFTKAADASNRAVMADTDEASLVFAHEAEQTTETVQSNVAALSPLLRKLGYEAEAGLLQEFSKRFGEYLSLDRSVLELAVENTNLKAQRLSFGPARDAADSFRDALETVGPGAKDHCRVVALVGQAVLAVRDIQVLQGPHIAEADSAAMTRMETQISGLEVTARDALDGISGLVDPKAQPQLAAALVSFERFKDLSRQIVALSRRNSNVRSLALSLREKPVLTAACDESLRSLEEALAKEGFTATR
jgi:hypothetical protein